MIGKIAPSGSSFVRALAYALNIKPEDQKLSEEELADKFPGVAPTHDDPGWREGKRHRVIGGNMSGETEQELRREFAAVRELRPSIKKPLMSMSVRKAPADTVGFREWNEIADQVIEGLGLNGCPYIVIQHRDKDDHIHVMTSRIRLDGKVISSSKSYEKVEQVMRKVEVKYGFEQVKGSKETYDRAPTWWEHKLVHKKGTLSPKLEMQARISAVLEDRPTTTQFINRLREGHDINAILRMDEDGKPSGIAFRYKDVTMSGGALGRGYTWKKLQERGLTYDERDIETVARASERAGEGGQSVTGRERAVKGAARSINDFRARTIDYPRGDSAIREEITNPDRREAQNQQYADRESITRRDQSASPAELHSSQANTVTGEEQPASTLGSATNEPPIEGATTSRINSDTINGNLFNTTANPISDFDYARLPTTVTGGSGEYQFVRDTSSVSTLDNGSSKPTWDTIARRLENLPSPEPSDALSGFRDELRAAFSEVKNYMQTYHLEEALCQSAITINPVDLEEVSAEAETGIEDAGEIIIEILEL